FPKYLKTQIETAFELDEDLFAQEQFLSYIGKAPAFSKALVKIMVEIYAKKSANRPKKDPRRCGSGEGIFEDSVLKAAVFDCPRSPMEDSKNRLAEELERYPQEEAWEDCYSEGGIEVSPPPPPPAEDFTKEKSPTGEPVQWKDSIAWGMSSDGSWDTPIPLSQTKGKKGESKKEDTVTTKDELEILDGCKIESSGFVLDETFTVISKLVQGDAKKLNRIKAACDDNGNVLHHARRVGKVELVPLAIREEQTSPPLQSKRLFVSLRGGFSYEETALCEEPVPEDIIPVLPSLQSDVEQNVCPSAYGR
ncbi:hypothetical protein LTS18_007652, partial [Coniosporium uncinatum]